MTLILILLAIATAMGLILGLAGIGFLATRLVMALYSLITPISKGAR